MPIRFFSPFGVFVLSVLGVLSAALPTMAQTDTSLLLSPERLGPQHILPRDFIRKIPRALSATRSLEDVDQLPFTVWTVTAEDILRFGFVTLGDVLRAAPGIRVSQPGNAVEGEMFLMRGLAGNQHVKVLINDVPITSNAAHGVTIGAQLPIRQAERIEVVYGPDGVLYGGEACAGVVNIILRETERPVFMQADLSFGSGGFNNLDLMFGGKIGRDRNLFRFSLYGSSTVRERWDVYGDQYRTHNPSQYHILDLRSQEYFDNPNFEPLAPNVNNPKLAPISHESRLFGGNFTWRGFHFTYHRMHRTDHTALGRNLMSVSWSNPGNRLSERWETLSIGHHNRKQSFFNTFSLSRYLVDNNSSSTYLFNDLFLAAYKTRLDPTQTEPQRKALRDEIFDEYASGERYASANALDLRLESRVRATFSTRLYWDFGLQVANSLGSGITAYYTAPVDVRHFTDYVMAEPFSVPNLSANDLRGNLFTQWTWHGKKLYLLGGISAYASLESESITVPLRLAGGYRIDSSWLVYANYGTGVRVANGYEHANRFVFYYTGSGYNAYSLFSNAFDAMTTVKAFEAGVRFTRNTFRVKGSFFQQKAYNLIRGGYLVPANDGLTYPHYEYGYQTADGLSMSMWGAQALISSEDQEVPLSLDGRRQFRLRGRTEFFMQYMEGKEYFGEPFALSPEIRNQPRWMAQFRFWTGTDKFEFMAASNLQQSVLSKAATYAEFWQRDPNTLISRYQRFRSWDFMLRIYLSKHLVAYCSIQNAFNRQISGLDATGTPQDLNFPVQQGRVWRFGVNYNLGE